VLASGEVDGKAIADEHVKQSKITHAEGCDPHDAAPGE
jgi:hypothetical protein